MKTIKKIICTFLMLAVFVGGGVLAGCAKTESADVLTVGVANNSNEVAILNTYRTAYKKANPGKDIKLVRITGNFDQQVNTLMGANNLPDVLQVYDFSAEYWTSKNAYVPISEYMKKDGIKEDDYFDSVIDIAKSGKDGDENMYWAPRDYNKIVVCYNKAIFDAADVAYPQDNWTWTQFLDICKALKAKTSNITAVTGQQIFYPVDMTPNWEAVYYPAIRSFGGDLFDRENATAIKDEVKVRQALDELLKPVTEGVAFSPAEGGAAPFSSKQCAMVFMTRPSVSSYANALKDASGKATIDFASLPAFEDVEKSYIGMGCTGYAITNQCSENKCDFAWDFLKFVMTEAGQNAICAAGNGVPTLKAMAEDKNAAFRQYLPEANHDAFIKFTERDLEMNYLSGLPTNKHLAVRSELLKELTKNYYSAQDKSGYLQELKTKLENAMR